MKCDTCGGPHRSEEHHKFAHGLKDSGLRVSLPSGMMKEATGVRGRYDLVSPIATRKLAEHTAKGALKYEERNWEKGCPISISINSAKRHLDMYHEGDRSEDHLTAAMWQCMTAVHTEEMVKRGLLPVELMDMPSYIAAPDLASEPVLSSMERLTRAIKAFGEAIHGSKG